MCFLSPFLPTLLCLQRDPSSGVPGWEAPLHEPILPDPLILPHSGAQAGHYCQLRQRQKAVQTHRSGSQLPGRAAAELSRLVWMQVSLSASSGPEEREQKVSAHEVCLTGALFLLTLSPLAVAGQQQGLPCVSNKLRQKKAKTLSSSVSCPCNSYLSKILSGTGNCKWKWD